MPYKMKSGKWRAERMFDNARRTRTFATKAEAKKWEAEQKPEPPAPIHTALLLATEYLDHCHGQFVKRTYQQKVLAFKYFFKFASPDISYESITAKQIYDCLSDRARMSGDRANRVRIHLRAWSAWVRRVHGLKNEAFEIVGKWKSDEAPRHIPTEDDFWQVHAAATPEDQTLLLAYLHTAARRSELFGLPWSDVDLVAGTIRLSTRKRSGGMQTDVIPMTSQLRDALAEHRKASIRSMYVFSNANGERYTKRQKIMHILCRKAGVPHFGFHAIRHLSASILAKAGLPLPTIQAILRHRSATTTALYLHNLGIVQNVLDSVFEDKLHKPSTQAKVVHIK
jgi:integrase